ncbi:unnamed protein product [Lupinus luteus]|uniref:S-protein homolog n=1 Tax=Lupinus luteus TaxID=3873 RepID=A0AAV1W0X9_LUPLU
MVISSSHVLFFSLLVLAPLLCVFHYWPILTYRHVYIRNDLGNGTLLTTHCKGLHDDLGVQKLNYQEEFKFQFKTNIWHTTTYFCGLTWDGKLHWLEAYKHTRDIHFCKDLKWSITNLRPCVLNCDTQKYDVCATYNQ